MAVTYVGGRRGAVNFVGLLRRLIAKTSESSVLGGFCWKAGAPITDTDLAYRDGDICWDSTNSDLYIASNTNLGVSTTTWTQIMGV